MHSNEDRINRYWRVFLENTRRDGRLNYYECFRFGLSDRVADELLRLVLERKKRATASSLLYFKNQNKPIPQAADLSIVTDGAGTPRCVIETMAVTVLPFRDVTFEICSREGEDEDLDSWRRNHIAFFTAEGEQSGYQFTWDMPVVFEDFSVVYS